MGGIGIRSFFDASDKIHKEIDADVEAQRVFYRDLMAGTSLTIQKNYIAAIPKLKKCFDKDHIYDKSVLIPLLEALNLTDDWYDAKPILDKLRSDTQKFDEINDATVYRVIASIEIQSGLSLRSRGELADGNARMDRGFALLKEALEITQPNDYDTRVHILNNSWIYHISNGQVKEAQEDVKAIASLPEEAQVYGWSNIQSWQCMKDFAATKDSKNVANLRIAAQQWKTLERRYRQ
jgi:tetratricopeptide (TPR) repeat protein